MMGMPACTNTLSWREKCMTSLRGTSFFVTSNWRMFFLSDDVDRLVAPLEQCQVGRAPRGAASVPETFCPAASTAL